MESCYVRIWNARGDRVFGWLGIHDNYAACVPAGVYSNPLKLPGVLVVQWRPGDVPGEGILAALSDDGDYGLGGENSDGVDAYWHWLHGAYTLSLKSDPDLKLKSPVPGAFSGTLAQTRHGRPFSLYSSYGINKPVFGLGFHDTPSGPDQLFKGHSVYLEFTTEELVFEFVPVSAFDPTRDSYAPAPKSKHDNWKKFDTPSWMGDLRDVIGNRPLAELVIPGSHDAASWDIPIAGGDQRSQTQSREIYGQLRAGSRYLDLRFFADCDGEWRGFHGGDTTVARLGPVLDDINRFLDENPNELLVISLLAQQQPTESLCIAARQPYTKADNIWDVVLTRLGKRIFPRCFLEKDKNGVETEHQHLVQNITQSGLLAQGKNIVLFSWGRPPTETVALEGPMKGQRQDYYIWAATPEDPTLTPGAKPWEGAFAAARQQGYSLDFDLAGVWLDSHNTTANDIRLMLGAVEPPSGGPLWMMHVNAPAVPGGKSIKTSANRIQPPLARLIQEDPALAAKLNFVNLDFVGDHGDMTVAVIEANLFR
jgi:hypothetical protein